MKQHFVAWWNLENLFDVEKSAQRPAWLQKELAGWNDVILDRKLAQLGTVIRRMNKNHGPDVLGVCEVENQPVLEKLLARLAMPGRNYGIAHADTKDQRGIDVAFLYDKKLFDVERQFSHTIMKRQATRELFQVNLKRKPGGKDLILVGNHWPSRSGGELPSEAYRMMAGETLSYWLERIEEIKGKDAPVLVMGDFNDEPHDRSMTEYLLGTHSLRKVQTARTPRMLNLMWPLLGAGGGTHYYDATPNTLDQFLVSRGFLNGNSGMQAKLDSVRVEATPEMWSGPDGGPRRFGRPSGGLDLAGFSDHFPISMRMDAV